MEIYRMVRMNLRFKEAFHLQMFRKKKLMNGVANKCLKNWVDYVGRIEIGCNVAMY